LAFLFDRETRLASHKEKRLVEIYHELVNKYHEYLLANEQDVEVKLGEYEKTREKFVEEYTYDFKAKTREKLEHKIKTVEQQQQAEHDDFIAKQKQERLRFEETQNNDYEEIITGYKEKLQNDAKVETEKAHKKFEENKSALK